jgi:predicted dehydrogenase
MVILSATGTARKRTLPALRDSDMVDVVGIQGRDEEKVRELAVEYGVESAKTDYDDLLDSAEYDFVFVASPPFLHEEHVLAALRRGKPVLCEKPLALSVDAAERIRREAEQSGVLVMVAHHLRHQPGVARVREMLAVGEVGRVTHCFAQWSFMLNADAPSASWKLDRELGGSNPFFDAGVHAIDLLIALFGAPRSAVGLVREGSRLAVPDSASVIVQFADVLSELHASQSARMPVNPLIIDGEEGTIFVPNAFGEASFDRLEVRLADGTESLEFPVTNCYRAEVEDFVRALDGAATPGTTLEQAIEAIRVMASITDCN